MALLFLVVGAILVISAINGREGDFFQAVGQDIPPVAEQLGAILLIGLIGYVPGMKTPSRALMALVIIVILLEEQGAWQNFTNTVTQFQSGQLQGILAPQAISPSAEIPVVTNQQSSSQGSSKSSSGGSDAGSILGGIAKFLPFLGL